MAETTLEGSIKDLLYFGTAVLLISLAGDKHKKTPYLKKLSSSANCEKSFSQILAATIPRKVANTERGTRSSVERCIDQAIKAPNSSRNLPEDYDNR